jgi:hypothetical protein
VSIITGVVVALGAAGLGVWAFVSRDHTKPWFYWTAPLLSLGFAAIMANFIAQYLVKVGRLETKGRPKRD